MEFNEIWVDIKGFEGSYKISNTGKIFSHNRNKLLKFSLNRNGYQKATLFKTQAHYFTVHRLVALNFIDNPLNLLQINHKDGNKQNNNVNNLEWCTCQYNITHSWETGLAKPIKHSDEYKLFMSKITMGENNPFSKLNNNQVIELRKDFNSAIKRKVIANKYNISLRNVYRIGNKTYYANII